MIDYDKVLSEKVRDMKPSGIRKFFDIAGTMEGVISLGVGEPDFSTPWAIRKAAIRTLERKNIIYGPNKGLVNLRTTISGYIAKKHGVVYNPDDEIIVTVGGSEAIDLAVRGIVNPGDEVLVVEPCFVCYAPLVELVGGVAVPVPTRIENNFKLTVDDLKDKITDKTKMLILPFPNNPTGAVMTREDLEPIAELLRDTDIMVLSDEIYSELTYGLRHFSIIELDGMRERTILVNGFSKAYAMTGWRLGYMAAPEPIISQLVKIHQYGIMCSPYISQNAAVEALTSCDAEVAKMVNEYNIRRRFPHLLHNGFLHTIHPIQLQSFDTDIYSVHRYLPNTASPKSTRSILYFIALMVSTIFTLLIATNVTFGSCNLPFLNSMNLYISFFSLLIIAG